LLRKSASGIAAACEALSESTAQPIPRPARGERSEAARSAGSG
jgi:hypothetical protein